MKEFIIFAVLIAVAYFFRNYQTFSETNLRPLAVQWNFDREGNPQVLCDLLAETATVKINDSIPKFKTEFNGYKNQACQYFKESAEHFATPGRAKNGYIMDKLEDFQVTGVDYVKGEATVSYTWYSVPPHFSLRTKKGELMYEGKTTTKMHFQLRPFKELEATSYEFTRNFIAVSSDRN